MSYLKINGVDYSAHTNALKVKKSAHYNAQTNAAGDTVVDYINAKRTVEVGITALDDDEMADLLELLDVFSIQLSFRNPKTNALEEINCILPEYGLEYYTIRAEAVRYNAFNITFIEL